MESTVFPSVAAGGRRSATDGLVEYKELLAYPGVTGEQNAVVHWRLRGVVAKAASHIPKIPIIIKQYRWLGPTDMAKKIDWYELKNYVQVNTTPSKILGWDWA